MIIIWGSRMYGKVDELEGMFHVATRFGHLWYIPLIPLKSHLIFRELEDGFEGIEIPMSGKSVLMAWMRTGLMLGFLVLGAAALAAGVGDGDLATGGIIGAMSAAALAGFIATKKMKSLSRCSRARARELAQKAGFNEEGMALLEQHFELGASGAPLMPS